VAKGKRREEEEATDQCFGWQLVKNQREEREEASNQCLGQQLVGKRSSQERQRGGCQSMLWSATFKKPKLREGGEETTN